ncbi:MAG: hypothetical protein PGN25_06205 [Methylorubrum populi]
MPLTWALTLQETGLPTFAERQRNEAGARFVRARDAYGRQCRAAGARKPGPDAGPVVDRLLSADEAVVRATQVARRLGERGLSLTNHSPRFYAMLFG